MKHGTLTAYVHGKCRCEDCRARASRYNKELRLRHQLKRTVMVDAAPVRAHVARLQQQGMSFRAIALAAGWSSRNSLASMLSRQRVHPQTAQRILAVRPSSDTRPDTYVDATGTRRRLQALAVMGHSARVLAERLGNADHSGVLDIQSGKVATVRRRTAQAVATLYDELWDVPGTARPRAAALRRGWLPPLAWDEDTIDDPHVTPDPRLLRPARETLHVDDVRELLEQGHTRVQVAERLGHSYAALEKALSRADIADRVHHDSGSAA